MRKNSRKFIIFLTVFLLVFSNLSGIVGHAASEEVNQSISIHVDKSEAGPGEDVLVSVSAAGKQNVSGISVNYQLPEGKYTEIATKFNPETGHFEAKIPVREYSVVGLWNAVGVNIFYDNGEPAEVLDYETDLSGGNFTIINENASVQDTTNPVLTSINVDKKAAYPGDIVKLSIAASDDLSGISQVEVYYSGYSSKVALAYYNDQTQKYEADIVIQDYERAGDRALNVINIYDYAGNNHEVSYDEVLTSGDFQVINDNEDVTAPTVHGVSVDKIEARAGDIVTWSFDIRDDKSGVAYVSVAYENPADPYNRQYGNAVYNESTKMFELKVPITEETLLGDWRIRYINVSDNANNGGNSIRNSAINGGWEFDFSPGNFKVVEKGQEDIDEQAPVLNGVTIDKVEAKPGEQVTVSLDVTDNASGVKYVTVTYQNEYLGSWTVDAIYNEETGKYDAVFPVDYETRTGKWTVPYIVVTDQNDNSHTYWYSDNTYFDSIAFSVVDESENDVTPPVINGMSVNKTEAQYGDEVIFSVDVSDDISGVKEVYVQYWNDHYGSSYSYAIYNNETKKFEIKFPIDYTTATGQWRVTFIQVGDNQNNYTSFYEGGEVDFSSSEFTVLTENMDQEPPTFNGVSIDKNEARPGDTVTVSVDAVDTKAGMNKVYVSFAGPNDYFSEIAEYNSETQKYEATFTVNDQTGPGNWSVYSIFMYDNAGNNVWLNNGDHYNLEDFTVINENIDNAPPKITGVTVDKSEANLGDTVTVSIDAVDDKTGVDYVAVEYFAGDRYLDELEAVFNQTTGKYEVKFSINDQSRPGIWSISSIYVRDKEYNGDYYYNGSEYDFSAADFSVINENADMAPPTVTSVSVDKTEVQLGETVTLSIDATDEKSDISYLEVRYRNDYYGSMYQEAVYNSETNQFEVTIPITEETKPGKWNLNRIYLEDSQGNYDSVYYFDDIDFSAGDYTVINDLIDITAPVVNSVSVDKKNAVVGDTVKVSLDVTDAKSGIDYVNVYLTSSTGGNIYESAQYNPETKLYEVNIQITETSKPGQWNIYYVDVRDSEYNDETYFNGENADFSAADFNVENEYADITAPVVQSVSVDKKEVQPGDTVTVSVDVTDDKSGVQFVDVYYYDQSGREIYESAYYNEETQKYDAAITIDNETYPGKWELSNIMVQDHEYNFINYQNGEDHDFSTGDFTVINDLIDIQAPEVRSVSVDKTEANPGDIVTVSIDAVDDKSGIDTVSVEYYTGSKYFDEEALYNPETGKYEAKLSITDTARPGVWSIESIYVGDNQYNGTRYYNGYDQDFDSGDFTVINENADMTPPTVASVSVDKTEAQPGDTVTVSIGASDDKSDISYLEVRYRNDYYGSMYRDAVYNSETNKFEVSIPITEDTKPGQWVLDRIYLEDSQGNYNSIYSFEGIDLSAGDYTVINDKIDITAPVVNNVSVDKTNAVFGDTVKVSLDVTDAGSGVEDVYVYLTSTLGGNIYESAQFNPDTNLYEVSLPISETFKPGKWNIYYVNVRDKEYNSETYYNGENDFSAADFNVVNEYADITPPVVHSVSVDKTEVQPGDALTVSLDVSDDKSGPQYVSIYYYDQDRREMYANAVYNKETQKYEATITIDDATYPGKWELTNITVQDHEYNFTNYQNGDEFDFSNGHFTVINDLIDNQAPKVTSISVDKKEANPGDTVTVSIEAVDDKSGIQTVKVQYFGGNRYLEEKEAVFNSETGKYEVEIPITDTARPGVWSISTIRVVDNNYNSAVIYNGYNQDLSGGDFTVNNENADMTPPTFTTVSVDKTNAKPGESVTISIEATDDKSGISYMEVGYRNSYGGYRYLYPEFNSETNKYEVEFTVDDKTKPGTWSLGHVQLSDNEGNSDRYYENISSGDFLVINENADVTPPVLNSVSVDKVEAYPGDVVKVSLDVSDVSGVAAVYVYAYGSIGGYIGMPAEYNSETKMYEVLLPINDRTKPGLWSISTVEVRDNEYNNRYYYDGDFDFTNADFTVINENADITPPTIKEVSVDKKVANHDEEVIVSITAVDDKSGVNRVTVDFRNNDGRSMLGEGIYNEITQKYDVKFKVSDNTRPGNWFVNNIYVVDGEWNSQNYSNGMDGNDFSAADFTVINENADVTPPTLLGVSVDKNSLQVGEEVTISFDVKDEQSDIGYINVNYKLPNRSYKNAQAYFNSLTGKYEAKIEIGKYSKSGTWVIGDVNVQDTEGNAKYIFNNKASSGYQGVEGMDLSSGNFVVKNDNEDITPPEVKSMTVNKTQFGPGETAFVELEVFDIQSGVNDVSIAFSGSNDGYVHTRAYYNETTQKYVAEIQVEDSTRPGLWGLEYIYVNDNEGNYQNLNNHEYDFSSVNYTIINEEVDIIPPAVNNISVDKQEVRAGEEITISLDVKDDRSTVEEVSAVLTNNNDNDPWGFADYINETAIYNEITQKFELKLQITEKMKPGSWGIQYLTVTDSEGNRDSMFQEEYADLLSGSTFTVINGQADVTLPTFRGITADKNVVHVGEEITFSVDASDESGIQDVFVVLDGTMDTYSGAIYNEKTNKYDITIPITEYYKSGTWKVQLITIYDKENNGIVLNSEDIDFSDLDFEIINDEFEDYIDNPADYINSISVDRKAAIPGDTVTLSINFKDSSNLRSVDVWYSGGMNNSFNREALYNQKTGNYEIKIPITSFSKPAFWSLRGIYAQEMDGTILNLFTNEKVDFTNGDFSVNNSKLDSVAPNAPVVNEVTDKSETINGTTEARVRVIVKAGDQELGNVISDDEGHFNIAINLHPAGTKLTVTAIDSSDNQSKAVTVTVVDDTPPVIPVVNTITDQDTTVTGTTEANTEVTVKVEESVIGSGEADAAGNFNITITKLTAGTTVSVVAKDAAGNSSEAALVTVIDKTPPAVPTVSKVKDQDTILTGTTEANAAITVNAGETVIGTGNADAAGKFSITITNQKAGTTLTVTAKDNADNPSSTEIVVEASYSPTKVQLNGKDFAEGGYYMNNTTYVNWNALKTFNISYTYEGKGLFLIGESKVQAVAINGDWYIQWKLLSPNRIIPKEISGGYNFVYVTPLTIHLNGKAFAQGGYYMNKTTYVNWNALKTFSISYSYKGNGVFLIEGRTVQAEKINGDWFIKWSLLSPEKISYKTIKGGYNFIYTTPIKIQLNGTDFAKGGYYRNNTTYVNWNALKTFNISFTYKGNGVFVIGDSTVQGEKINGDWYIKWSSLSPGRIIYKVIDGGYNFIYVTPKKIKLNGKDFAKGGYFMNNTTYVNWNALKIFNISYTYKGYGVFVIGGITVQAEAINGDWYIQWKVLAPGKITYKVITGGYNFIYKP
jgi:hypothetical protein